MTKSELTKRIKATVKGLYLNCIINQTDKAPDFIIYEEHLQNLNKKS